jgi:hypothetical protein
MVPFVSKITVRVVCVAFTSATKLGSTETIAIAPPQKEKQYGTLRRSPAKPEMIRKSNDRVELEEDLWKLQNDPRIKWET